MTDVLIPKAITIPSYPNASLPASPPNGYLVYDSTNNKLMISESGSWKTVTTT